MKEMVVKTMMILRSTSVQSRMILWAKVDYEKLGLTA